LDGSYRQKSVNAARPASADCIPATCAGGLHYFRDCPAALPYASSRQARASGMSRSSCNSKSRQFWSSGLCVPAGSLYANRLGTLKSPFVRKHCEYYGVPIKRAQPKHRTHADTGPAKQFLRKQRGYAPYFFRSRRQSRRFARSGFGHLLIVSQVLPNSPVPRPNLRLDTSRERRGVCRSRASRCRRPSGSRSSFAVLKMQY
jgi:hypothetical protein